MKPSYRKPPTASLPEVGRRVGPSLPPTSLLRDPADNVHAQGLSTKAILVALAPMLELLAKVAELAPLVPVVHDAVARAATAEQLPEYLDKATLARQLSTSITSVDRLCRDGLPYVRLGDVRRFRLADVRAWLEARGGRS